MKKLSKKDIQSFDENDRFAAIRDDDLELAVGGKGVIGRAQNCVTTQNGQFYEHTAYPIGDSDDSELQMA